MSRRIIVIGAGIGGLTAANLLQQSGYDVTVFEAQTYPGGSASTYTHKGFRFESGATLVGGFQPDGPHAILGDQLNLDWPVRQHDPAWVTHLSDRSVALTKDYADVLAKFPASERFWQQQRRIADIAWSLSAQGLPWPPRSASELAQLVRVGLVNLPEDLRVLPFAFTSVHDWLRWHGLHHDQAFVRFLDAQLLIAAQTTSRHTNALYGATALDLARQGVYHVEGGIGGIAETLARKLTDLGGRILYRHRVTRINTSNGRATGVAVRRGRHSQMEMLFPADFVIANTTPWNLDMLLKRQTRESRQRDLGWGAFVLHLGVKTDAIPDDFPDHHQIIAEIDGPLGETRSLFISFSPTWDSTRAPEGQRAVTVTTHTAVQPWWDLLKNDRDAYYQQKQDYTDRALNRIENLIPGFKSALTLVLPGSPVTYQFYTERHLGMVGGFPQTSLLRVRGPRTGIGNVRLVGDSIFPGQSTAGVTLGAMRVAEDVRRTLPITVNKKALRVMEPGR